MLHILNKSPLETNTLDTVLRLAPAGALLLIEDAVYAATRGAVAEPKLRQAMERMKVYALAPDLAARGMADRLIDGVATVDYDGFVELVVEHPNSQSWL
ncbi:MAG: sulfurtransferase complex subunit TusB [Burkholderiales bacterium]|jgi:tRNA 2-thiouridine synthesizing protein B|nr:sulfurtransferase complex subunit TusB [Burkholderiales bacterium]